MKKTQRFLTIIFAIMIMTLSGCGGKSKISDDDPVYQKWNIVGIEDKKGLVEKGTIMVSRAGGDGLSFDSDGTMKLVFNRKTRTATFKKEDDDTYSYKFDKANAQGEIYSDTFSIVDDTISLDINGVKFVFAVDGSDAETKALDKLK